MRVKKRVRITATGQKGQLTAVQDLSLGNRNSWGPVPENWIPEIGHSVKLNLDGDYLKREIEYDGSELEAI